MLDLDVECWGTSSLYRPTSSCWLPWGKHTNKVSLSYKACFDNRSQSHKTHYPHSLRTLFNRLVSSNEACLEIRGDKTMKWNIAKFDIHWEMTQVEDEAHSAVRLSEKALRRLPIDVLRRPPDTLCGCSKRVNDKQAPDYGPKLTWRPCATPFLSEDGIWLSALVTGEHTSQYLSKYDTLP